MSVPNGRSRKRILHGPIELPGFAGEAEEARFWDSVEFSEDYLRNGPEVPEDEAPPIRVPHLEGKGIEASELREWRKRLGLTQAELAEALQIPRATISRWELGLVAIAHGQMLRLALERLEARLLHPAGRHR